MIATSRLRKAMHDIAAKKGDFSVFALFKRPDALGEWDLVVSAPWLGSGSTKATRSLIELLARSIGRGSLQELARVVVVGGAEPDVKFLLENLPVDDGELRVKSTELFGLQIEEAIIFRAKKLPIRGNGLRNRTLATAGGSSRGRR